MKELRELEKPGRSAMTAAERLEIALHDLWDDGCQEGTDDARRHVGHVLAADPDLAADLEFAMSWRAAEKALPDGWIVKALSCRDDFNNRPEHLWEAAAWLRSGSGKSGSIYPTSVYAYGETPAQALTSLATALETEK